MTDSESGGPSERQYGYMRCPCCERRRRIYVGEIWGRSYGDGSLRIVSPEKDGAIVEQVERPHDGRWGISYRDLLAGYRLTKAEPKRDVIPAPDGS